MRSARRVAGKLLDTIESWPKSVMRSLVRFMLIVRDLVAL